MELYFDTDQGRQMARKMLQASQRVDTAMQSAQRTCDALVGAGWLSPAATQFQHVLRAWLSAMKPTQQLLNDNKLKLEREIAEWEETGRSFDGAAGGGLGGATGNGGGGGVGASANGQGSTGAGSGDGEQDKKSIDPTDLEGKRGKIYDKKYGGPEEESGPVKGTGKLYEKEGSASAAVGDVSGSNDYGSAEAAVLKAEASGKVGASASAKDGLSAEASGNAGAYVGEAEVNGHAGPVSAGARGAVGADAHGNTGVHFGKDGAHVKASAGGFAGARVDASTGVEAGPVGVEAKGGVGAGIGGDVKADVGYDKGKVHVKLGAHGYLGVGGGGEIGVTVDVPELAGDVVDGAAWTWDKITP